MSVMVLFASKWDQKLSPSSYYASDSLDVTKSLITEEALRGYQVHIQTTHYILVKNVSFKQTKKREFKGKFHTYIQ